MAGHHDEVEVLRRRLIQDTGSEAAELLMLGFGRDVVHVDCRDLVPHFQIAGYNRSASVDRVQNKDPHVHSPLNSAISPSMISRSLGSSSTGLVYAMSIVLPQISVVPPLE